MKKLKVGFVMGGGVSMGSFSSGALSEVINLLKNNINTDKYSDCEIDVFTGASAGSVTLAIAAFQMARGKDPSKMLEKIWTDDQEGLSIETLIPKSFRNIVEPSILSTEIIKKLRSEIFKNENKPQSVNDKHSLLSNDVRLTYSLTNLNGVKLDLRKEIHHKQNPSGSNSDSSSDDNLPRATIDTAVSFAHKDARKYRVVFNDDHEVNNEGKHLELKYNDINAWCEMSITAQASGAFPIAFPAKRITRQSREYGRLWPFDANNKKEIEYSYADGGILNNEPLKHCANEAIDKDKDDETEFERVFIVIDPLIKDYEAKDKNGVETGKVRDTLNDYVGCDLIHSYDFTKMIPDYGKTLASSILSSARFKDWQKAYKINNQIDWEEKLVKSFLETVKGINSQELLEIQTAILRKEHKKIIKEKYFATSSNVNKQIPDNQKIEEKIKKQYASMEKHYKIESYDLTNYQKDYALAHIAILENVAGLRNKQKISVIGISPNSDEQIIGELVSGFGGFFKQEWRNYDYQIGRLQARDRLKKAGLIKEPDDEIEIPEINKHPENYNDFPRKNKNTFESHLTKIANSEIRRRTNLLQRLGIGLLSFAITRKRPTTVLKDAIKSFLMKPKDENSSRYSCVTDNRKECN